MHAMVAGARDGSNERSMSMDTITLGWGLRKEIHGARAAWGARAIFHHREYSLDFLHDRQSAGGAEADRRRLAQWLSKKRGGGIQLLTNALKAKLVTPSSDVTVRVDHGRYHAVASPQQSYGYMYVTAWIDPEPEATSEEVTR